jgi:hypothetical protein
MELESSLPCLRDSITALVLLLFIPVLTVLFFFKIHVNIICPHTHLGLSNDEVMMAFHEGI